VIWHCRDHRFDLARRALVMGIVNVTPDSFSDGGRFLDPSRAVDRALEVVGEGADIVDLGAESTRPGAVPVPAEEQLRRLMPVVERLGDSGVTLSIDTTLAAVAGPVLAAGARIINDVSALSDPGMSAVVAASGAGVVLVHMRGTPATMQQDPRYEDAAGEVRDGLAARLARARSGGVAPEQIVLDPGIGFGKTMRHNLELIARLDELLDLRRPLLVGVSRKSFIGTILDLPADDRVEGGLAAAAVAVFLGARVVRTHDVRPTARAVRMAEALRDARRVGEGTGAR
jgi:dihydropteroate synthase